MASKETIKQTLFDELTTVLSKNTSITDTGAHVDLLDDRGENTKDPFLGFEMFGQPNNRGLGGNVHVDEVVYSGGEIDYITHRIDTTLTVDIGILSSDPHLKDQLYTAVRQRFAQYIGRGRANNLHADIERVRDGGYSDESRPDDGVHGDRQQYAIDYGFYYNVTDYTPITEINLSIEDLDESVVYDSATLSS